MFTGPEPVDVTRTRIFARASRPDRQVLAYQMDFTSRRDVAMILPLPVSLGAGEDALRFISLEHCPNFFEQLERGFPRHNVFMDMGVPDGGPRARLPVHQVGLFDASFVPRLEDFDRLDPRFRLTDEVWLGLPDYWDHGFAVFRLRGAEPAVEGGVTSAGSATTQTVHPMALEFRREPSKSLFFPTVHVHDGSVHPRADFRHTLYAQARVPAVIPYDLDGHGNPRADRPRPFRGWRQSAQPAARFVATERTQGLIDPDLFCFRLELEGLLDNRDTIVLAEWSS